jgi:hypothetical protein
LIYAWPALDTVRTEASKDAVGTISGTNAIVSTTSVDDVVSGF